MWENIDRLVILSVNCRDGYSLLLKTESLDNHGNTRPQLIGLAIMVYEPSYHALQIWQLYESAQN